MDYLNTNFINVEKESKNSELTQDNDSNNDWGFYKLNSFCESGISIEDNINQNPSNSIISEQNSAESLNETNLKNILAETHYMNKKLIVENNSYRASVSILERREKSLLIKIDDLKRELQFRDEMYNLDMKNELFVPFGISFMIGSIIGGISTFIYFKLK